ncbi:MAG: aminopeptidase P family protein [Candidatus Cloacimonetes bacterium]|nr:aminopeptidase P family protein [Candidatus Cloacimonadota bacterium]
MKTGEKLKELRDLMLQKGIDAWIIPSGDPHQSEYTADHWKARSWLSGFSGSAGTCVVTADKAGLWTDSRYWIQAANELSGSGIELFKMFYPGVPNYRDWLLMELPRGAVLGFDGSLLSIKEVEQIEKGLSVNKIKLQYKEDLVGMIWQDRPPIPRQPAVVLSEEYSGESVNHKIKRVRVAIEKARADYHVISALDEIAWLFNIRGRDVKYNPIVISYAFLSKDDICLFINKTKLSPETLAVLEESKVKFFPYENIFEFLSLLPADKKLLFDPGKISQKLKEAINCQLLEGKSIVTDLKGIKNEVEQQGIRQAHIQDGVSLVRWIFWMQQNVGKVEMDEYTAGQKLGEFRENGDKYQGPSFNPIVGFRGNGAIVHYSAKPQTARKIERGGLLLVDSGGQYLNGTTDVTRTFSLGNITEEEKYYFTLVLAGHIDLARSVFPKGTPGAVLDAYTRTALWREKLDYGHGTGHGVGHYLCVHEGPQGISIKSTAPILPGSVTTNEPGMYLEGKFGIRTENMMICQTLETTEYGEFCCFETVTLCPISRDLVNKEMLTIDQIAWLDAYHERVYDKLSPHLMPEEQNWLRQETLPL